MKKFILVLAAAVIAVAASAQVYVGGSVGIASVKNGAADKTTTAFNIIPEIGYNLDDAWALGIKVGYQQGASLNAVEDMSANEDVKQFTVEPYARYTFAKLGPVSVFTDLGFSYQWSQLGVDNDAYKYNTYAIGVKPGVSVNLSKHFSFIAHAGFLGYKNSKCKLDGSKANQSYGLDFNATNLNFGLLYNF